MASPGGMCNISGVSDSAHIRYRALSEKTYTRNNLQDNGQNQRVYDKSLAHHQQAGNFNAGRYIHVILQAAALLAAFSNPGHRVIYAPGDFFACRLEAP